MANAVYLVDHTAREFLQVFLSDNEENEDLADCANPQDTLNFLWHRYANRVTVEYSATIQFNLFDGTWKDAG